MNTIINIIQNAQNNFGPKTALQIREGNDYFRVTYRELHDSAQKIAFSLRQLGIKKSDKISLLTDNSPTWGMAFFGILWAGGIAVPIDGKLKEHSISNLIQHSESKAVFTSLKYKTMIQKISTEFTRAPLIITLDEKDSGENKLTLDALILQGNEKHGISLEKPKPEDLAIILYTSGTTGSPKGVMLTHGNITSNVEGVASVLPFNAQDKLISILPLCHTYAITGDFLLPLHTGGTITYVENLKGPALLERLKENQGTIIVAVPAILQMMFHHLRLKIQALPKARYWTLQFLKRISRIFQIAGIPLGHLLFKSLKNQLSPKLRFMVSGGAPIDPKIIREFDLFGIRIYQGYGLTETSPILTVNGPGKNKIGSVGKTIPGVQIKFEKGEILARGPNIMKGYFKNPQATQEILKEGWLHTGDLGSFDPHGYLHISGRSKNIIVSRGGKNINPEEVEEELSRNPWIKEGCVVGLRKEIKGALKDEIVYALVVPNLETFRSSGIEPGDSSKADPRIETQMTQAIKTVNSRLADYKRIRGFEIWNELPKTTTLKIKRKEILEILQQRGAQPIGGEVKNS